MRPRATGGAAWASAEGSACTSGTAVAVGAVAAPALPSTLTPSGDLAPGLDAPVHLLGLVVLVGVINASARRPHDIGMSGWWNLLLIAGVVIVP